jgi:subtilisin family serine protease
MSRFVLARDVAERLGAAPEERHPVLIEVLEPGYRAMDEDMADMHAIEAGERSALAGRRQEAPPPLMLAHRIESAAQKLRSIVRNSEAARIDPLRRFVAAHLTADELRQVGAMHKDMRVFAVWQSSRKSKLTGRSMRSLKADAALASFGADGASITWAVLDTGVRADHPHFSNGDGTSNVIQAVWDCTQRGRPVKIDNAKDADGHGTHVAGIISGKSPNSAERGAAPRANLVVYKVLDDKGQGEDAWIIKALDHIAEQNENVANGLAIHGLNLSLGGPFDNTVYGCGFSPICAELRRLWRSGVLVVVACGNEGTLQVQTPDGETEINSAMSIGDPANLDDCIAVGSVNADRPHLYGVSAFSSRGPTADGRAKPDVVAPGERIRSCNARFRSPKDWYYEESGTSMAAPHVSGLLAAFLSVRREFRGRPDEVKAILLNSCVDLGRDRYHQGRGMPNLMQMLLTV